MRCACGHELDEHSKDGDCDAQIEIEPGHYELCGCFYFEWDGEE